MKEGRGSVCLKRNMRDEITRAQQTYTGKNLDPLHNAGKRLLLIFQEVQRKKPRFILLWQNTILYKNLRNSYIMTLFHFFPPKIGFILFRRKIILCKTLRNISVMTLFHLAETQEAVHSLYIHSKKLSSALQVLYSRLAFFIPLPLKHVKELTTVLCYL